MDKINMDKLRAAHEAELREAGIEPGLLILPSKLVTAFVKYLELKDSSEFFSGVAELLKTDGAERAAQEKFSVAAFGARQRVEGAKAIFTAIGLDMDKIETEGSGKT